MDVLGDVVVSFPELHSMTVNEVREFLFGLPPFHGIFGDVPIEVPLSVAAPRPQSSKL